MRYPRTPETIDPGGPLTDDLTLDSHDLALEVLHRIFSRIDTDGNTRISPEELTVALTDLGFENPDEVAASVMAEGTSTSTSSPR
jgi:Ca2+-binding EF-hand superfamily protein